jgi:hypothetical protein
MLKFSKVIAALLLTASISECKKVDVPEGTPYCIKKEIRKILKEDKRNPSAKMWQYTYHGETVYYIPPYCCDQMGVLFNNKCDIICHPDGGLTGGGDGKCTDFFQSRTNEKLVWEDTR